jgi:hypothetical protein
MMTSRTQRKNLIWDLMEKGHDTQFIFDYLLDHAYYSNIIHSLDVAGKPRTDDGYNLLSDWEKEDLKSIDDEMWNRGGGCAVSNALMAEGIE